MKALGPILLATLIGSAQVGVAQNQLVDRCPLQLPIAAAISRIRQELPEPMANLVEAIATSPFATRGVLESILTLNDEDLSFSGRSVPRGIALGYFNTIDEPFSLSFRSKALKDKCDRLRAHLDTEGQTTPYAVVVDVRPNLREIAEWRQPVMTVIHELGHVLFEKRFREAIRTNATCLRKLPRVWQPIGNPLTLDAAGYLYLHERYAEEIMMAAYRIGKRSGLWAHEMRQDGWQSNYPEFQAFIPEYIVGAHYLPGETLAEADFPFTAFAEELGLEVGADAFKELFIPQ